MKINISRYQQLIPLSLLLFLCLAAKKGQYKPGFYPDTQLIRSSNLFAGTNLESVSAARKNYMVFANFQDAFSFVFTDAKSKFIHARRSKPFDQVGNFRPTIYISDSSATPENSFHRGHEWAFRFTMVVSKEDAAGNCTQTDNMIRSVLNRNSVKYNKSVLPFDHGDSPITSYQYKDRTAPLGYRVEFTRFTSVDTVNEEVIIYYSDYIGYL